MHASEALAENNYYVAYGAAAADADPDVVAVMTAMAVHPSWPQLHLRRRMGWVAEEEEVAAPFRGEEGDTAAGYW